MQATGLRAKLQEANTAGDGNAMFDGQMPDRWAFAYNDMPRPVVRVGDAVYGLDNSLNDSLNFYFQDDDTVCYARRILVNDTLPDSFAMQILPSYATRPAADGAGAEKYQTLLGTEGDWTLECGVDITSTRGAVKNAEPQVLTLGESKLDLKKFSVSPLGAVAVVDEHFTGGIGEGDVVQKDGYTSLEQYAVRDSAGNWMYWMRPSGWTVGEESLYEFVKPADGVDSLTFVPVLYSGTAQAQEALAPLERGAKLEVTNLSGYTVESFVLDGRRLELTLAPYGPQAYGMVGLEIEPCGAGLARPPMTKNRPAPALWTATPTTRRATSFIQWTSITMSRCFLPRCSSAIQSWPISRWTKRTPSPSPWPERKTFCSTVTCRIQKGDKFETNAR